ncbi:MAG: sulfur carrier protein ThiS [Phycisphaerae bacterium]|nr:sulfur carrier protein ThiS [Phycisphaerae bacterium]
MKITVNDTIQEMEEGATVTQLLNHLNLPGPTAVELNREICRKKNHATTVLNDGDKLEIVTIVGGG